MMVSRSRLATWHLDRLWEGAGQADQLGTGSTMEEELPEEPLPTPRCLDLALDPLSTMEGRPSPLQAKGEAVCVAGKQGSCSGAEQAAVGFGGSMGFRFGFWVGVP